MTWFAELLLGSYHRDLRLRACAISGHAYHTRLSTIHLSFLSDGSYMMVLCSRLRRSNIRTLPSAPQLTNTSTLFAQNRTSKTSLSCAISWVLAVNDGISQMVHVVSMLDVIMRLGDKVFQSSEVRGAVCSGDLEFERRARGVSFCTVDSLLFDDLVIELLVLWEDCAGRDHSRR